MIKSTQQSFIIHLFLLLNPVSGLYISSSLFKSHKRELKSMRKGDFDDTHYYCSPFLDDVDRVYHKTALIILNSPIKKPPSPIFQKLWHLSSFRVCADGGANRLYDATSGSLEYLPDLIIGDLDSLRDEVRDYFKGKGVRIEKNPCQESNDLDKCLQVLRDDWIQQSAVNCRICVYGAFGGRFDQEMASIQALFKWKDQLQRCCLSLFDDYTTAFILKEGVTTEIRLSLYGEKQPTEFEVGDGPTCGLIPIGTKCDSIKTHGLKWNLNGDCALEFGGLVSTSNRIIEEIVTIHPSHPVIFTAEVLSGPT
jgi:thiamine pyrophosphokinase